MEKTEMKKMMDKANVFFEKINKKLLPEYKGKIIAIDVDSGDYFMGDDVLNACKKARKKYPDKIFVCKRIGVGYVHRVLTPFFRG